MSRLTVACLCIGATNNIFVNFYGEKIFDTVIPEASASRSRLSCRQSLSSLLQPMSDAARRIGILADEMLTRIDGRRRQAKDRLTWPAPDRPLTASRTNLEESMGVRKASFIRSWRAAPGRKDAGRRPVRTLAGL